MFFMVQCRVISLILSALVYISNANEYYLEEYKENQFPEILEDIVIELPVYEPVKEHPSQNYIVPQTSVPLKHSSEFETTTISSIFNNNRDEYIEPIMEASNMQHFSEYIKTETSQPEQTSIKTPTITSTRKINDLKDSIVQTDDAEVNQLIKEFKLKYNKNAIRKINYETKTQQLKPLNKKKMKISKQSLQNQKNKNNNVKNSYSKKQQTKYLNKRNIKNNFSTKSFKKLKKINDPKKKKPRIFTGFGHTFKTLNSFLSMDKFFTDILKPIEKNLDEIEENPTEPVKTNLYTLIAKATSLKNNENDKNLSNNVGNKIISKPISKKLNKRNNNSEKYNKTEIDNISKETERYYKPEDEISIGQRSLNRDKRQQQLRKSVKNFKLTMQMLSNIDKYVSNMLKSYFEKLANYMDDDDDDDNNDDSNENEDRDYDDENS